MDTITAILNALKNAPPEVVVAAVALAAVAAIYSLACKGLAAFERLAKQMGGRK